METDRQADKESGGRKEEVSVAWTPSMRNKQQEDENTDYLSASLCFKTFSEEILKT